MTQPIANPDAQAAALTALRRLVASDTCNYQRDTMRYAGLFDDARTALAQLDGTPIPAPHRGNDPLIRALREIHERIDATGRSDASWVELARAIGDIGATVERALDPATW